MPNIIRIRDLINETDLNGVIIPIDKTGYTYNAQQINILDLKEFILSGFTGGTGGSGTSGTSGVDGLDGEDGTTPCVSVNSNIITIIVNQCYVDGIIECDNCYINGIIECVI